MCEAAVDAQLQSSAPRPLGQHGRQRVVVGISVVEEYAGGLQYFIRQILIHFKQIVFSDWRRGEEMPRFTPFSAKP